MNRGSFIVHIKTNGIYKNIAEKIETRFDTSNYELNDDFLKDKINKSLD